MRMKFESLKTKLERSEIKYDYLIVGAGLSGCVLADVLSRNGKKCLVIDRNNHVGGRCYTENIENINVHMYGPHIFHTNSINIWHYITKFASFNNFVNSPIANYKDKLYNLPFNMNTFWQIYELKTPQEVIDFLSNKPFDNPKNLEEQAINLVGEKAYKILIKEYTEKQWQRDCTDLPASIIERLPVRLRFDNNYFNDRYQGIPKGGYTPIFNKMLENCDVLLGVDFANVRLILQQIAKEIIWTGSIDEYFGFTFGKLEYIGRRFDIEVLKGVNNYQGVAVMNYTSKEKPYLRIVEHKHFEFGDQESTVITKEYTDIENKYHDQSYPVNDQKNNELYRQYISMTFGTKQKIHVAGRLGTYKYLDMDDTIDQALNLSMRLLKNS